MHRAVSPGLPRLRSTKAGLRFHRTGGGEARLLHKVGGMFSIPPLFDYAETLFQKKFQKTSFGNMLKICLKSFYGAERVRKNSCHKCGGSLDAVMC